MKVRTGLLGLMFAAAVPVFATDHNNLDSGRPLRFDDAYSIAYRERDIEFGFGLGFPSHRSALYDAKVEYKYGFAPNRDIGVAFEPSIGGGDSRFNANNVGLSYFQQIQREIGNGPALAYRVDVFLPTGLDSRGVDGRLRGIVTKTVAQYDKLHLNFDVNLVSKPYDSERKSSLGVILGYSKPIGYPRDFNTTFVAEFAMEQSRLKGEGWTGTAGVGIRRQIGVRSVVDFGVESDLSGPSRTPFRLVAGYSIAF